MNSSPLQSADLLVINQFLKYPQRIRTIKAICRELNYSKIHVVSICERLKELRMMVGPDAGAYKLVEARYVAYRARFGPYSQN